MKKTNMIIALSALAFVGASCSQKTAAPKGIDAANLDTTVSAKADFYDYACGGWMKANPLKPEYSRFGTFDQLAENTREQVRGLVDSLAAATAEPGTNAQKVADLYRMGMDSVRLNNEGAAPLAADLELIASTPREKVIDLMATMPGLGVFFGTGVQADLANSNMNTMYWEQGGLGLGDRDYYTNNTENAEKIRAAYRTYLTTLAKLIGYDDAAAQRLTDNVVKIETELANSQMTRTEQRDIAAQYNPMTVAELVKTYPNIDLKHYFDLQKLDVDTVIVGQPQYYAVVSKVLKNADEQALRDYMTASYVSSAAPYLSDDFIAANFALDQAISGVEEQRPRWKRALAVPNGILGEALGELYVEKYFPASSKEKMLKLVGNLQTALGQHIDNLTWMSDSTKANAQKKLAAFTVKIGYPDKWKDYSSMEIDPALSYYENMHNVSMWHQNELYSKWGKPVDKTEWGMTPQTVNAYYNPMANEIVFPAAILQAPFFDPEASDAENYGGIGVVIGHEMTHGFDDQGRNFDAEGNMVNWWTEEDAQAFAKLTNGLVAQFDEVEVLPGLHANGQYTLGENIADQGGLRIAMTAFLDSQNQKGVDVTGEDAMIDGFDPIQVFYMNYANLWAQNIRDEEIRSLTTGDVHSLGKNRVNVTLRNLEPFFTAFGIKEGDPMFRPEAERVVIW